MGCMFVMVCGRNPGACCHECEVECFHECSLSKEECDFYDASCNSDSSINADSLPGREE